MNDLIIQFAVDLMDIQIVQMFEFQLFLEVGVGKHRNAAFTSTAEP